MTAHIFYLNLCLCNNTTIPHITSQSCPRCKMMRLEMGPPVLLCLHLSSCVRLRSWLQPRSIPKPLFQVGALLLRVLTLLSSHLQSTMGKYQCSIVQCIPSYFLPFLLLLSLLFFFFSLLFFFLSHISKYIWWRWFLSFPQSPSYF